MDAPPPPSLKFTELLPKPVNGNNLSQIDCRAHLLSYEDYLSYHKINNFEEIRRRFVFTLEGPARLWANSDSYKNCPDFPTLKRLFINRFSPCETNFSLIKQFDSMTFNVRGNETVTLDGSIAKIAQGNENGDI